MLGTLFYDEHRRRRDRQKAMELVVRHGDRAINILEERVSDARLTTRDRRHWRRVLRHAKILA